MRVLFDTCIIIDYFLNRNEFSNDAKKIILSVTDDTLCGFITVKSLMDIYYIIRKHLHNENKTRDIIHILLDSFILLDSTKLDAIKALALKNNDYEDALMIESAISNNIDYIVTRNIKDYKNSSIPIISPKNLYSLINHQTW